MAALLIICGGASDGVFECTGLTELLQTYGYASLPVLTTRDPPFNIRRVPSKSFETCWPIWLTGWSLWPSKKTG